MERTFPSEILITIEDGVIHVNRPSDEAYHRALHGMTRALINNMVVGVNTGFEKVLEVNGVGYRAEVDGKRTWCFMLVIPIRWSLSRQPVSALRRIRRPARSKCWDTIKSWSGRLPPISARSAHRSLIKAKGLSTWKRKFAARLARQVRCSLWRTKKSRSLARVRRHVRVRKHVSGNPQRPRLNVFRSLAEIYAQVIDDESGLTLAVCFQYRSRAAGEDVV